MSYLYSHFNFSKLPWTVGRVLWQKLDTVDLITLAITSRNSKWFSKSIVSIPIKFSVNYEIGRFGCFDHWLIRMDFKDKPSFLWYFYPNAGKLTGTTMKLKIGEHVLLSQINSGSPRSLHSFLIGFQDSLFELVDWLCDFFRCKVTEINTDLNCISDYDTLVKYNVVKIVPKLTITNCDNQKIVADLLNERSSRHLRTTIKFIDLNIFANVTVESFLSLDFTSFQTGLTRFDVNFFADYLKVLLRNNHPDFQFFGAKLQKWTPNDLNVFTSKLNLTAAPPSLRNTHYGSSRRYHFPTFDQIFMIDRGDGTLAMFAFTKKEEGEEEKKKITYTNLSMMLMAPRPRRF